MRGNSSHGNREIPSLPDADGATGRPEKATSRTSGMHGDGKSDGCIIPQKPPNKDGLPTSAEGVEGRQPTEGNTLLQAPCRTQSRVDGSSGLQRVREQGIKVRDMVAKIVLEQGIKVRDMVDIAQRVAALEKIAEARKGQ
jgi:hypothetical protein